MLHSRITIHEVINVPKMDTFGWADPYVVVTGAKGGTEFLKTPHLAKEKNPIYRAKCEVQREEAVIVQVFDKDFVTADELIGEVRVDCREPLERVGFPLKDKNGKLVPDMRIFISLVIRANRHHMAIRLQRMFEHYAPERESSVTSLVDDYEWREDELIRALVQQYGPEPAMKPGDAPPPLTVQERLVRFFECYAPEKLPTVDVALDKWAGREEQLMDALVTKYGPEPSRQPPGNSDAGHSAAMPAPLGGAPEPTPSSGSTATTGPDSWTRARLQRILEHHCPEKLGNIDIMLEKYAGREDQLFDALANKYGPEPGAPGLEEPRPPKTEVAASVDPNLKARLTRFYERYCPDKLPAVDATLLRYAGREDQLFDALANKYGPEPGAP